MKGGEREQEEEEEKEQGSGDERRGRSETNVSLKVFNDIPVGGRIQEIERNKRRKCKNGIKIKYKDNSPSFLLSDHNSRNKSHQEIVFPSFGFKSFPFCYNHVVVVVEESVCYPLLS